MPYALGYTTSSSGHRSYKILRRYYSQNDKKVLGEIYEFTSDSWRVLDASFPLLGYSVNRNGVCLKGDAYFVAPRDKVNDAFLITKFDFTTETLVRLPLPFQNLHPWDKAFLSVVRDEKIALLHVWRIYISDEYMEKQVYEANKISTFDWPRIISYEEKYTYEEAKETEAVL
ncbi:PREDICTED: putative F-box/kelch-repeat protein At3g17540 [Brassica oleracea var. oleracea]|uniref:putative F-box/kelch-repeat protein At3g17540 n=1 Tax=Brassica oleracea var. oleracea TaxID=109376 RepID=UPI0006A6A646|nr:PREDICTED: putative F-box/kelch-repeat protein At3g17540 [Brassica oleracea var. oleracea]